MEQWNKLRTVLSVNKLRVPPARNKGGTGGGMSGTRGVSVSAWEVFSPVRCSRLVGVAVRRGEGGLS